MKEQNKMSKKRVFISGAGGFIGRNLSKRLSAHFQLDLADLNISVTDLPIDQLDVTRQEDLNSYILPRNPDIIIHLAGLKNLNYCEKNPVETFRVNTLSTRYLVEIANRLGAHFIFISTDYIFDGKRGNYSEDDLPLPTTVYGKTNLSSEEHIRSYCLKFSILRTSAVYGLGSAFFDWIIDSLDKNISIDAFTDAHFTPTYIGDVCWAFERIIREPFYGTLHFAGVEILSRYTMACEVAFYLGKDQSHISPASIKESNLLIAENCSLKSDKAIALFGRRPKSLLEGLRNIYFLDEKHVSAQAA